MKLHEKLSKLSNKSIKMIIYLFLFKRLNPIIWMNYLSAYNQLNNQNKIIWITLL